MAIKIFELPTNSTKTPLTAQNTSTKLVAMFIRKHLESCGSTNQVALEWSKNNAPHKSLVTCNEQTQGRGQQGHIWSHYAGAIAASYVLRPQVTPQEASKITLMTAEAAVQALKLLGLTVSIKWPNDLLLMDGRKVAGILAEAHSTGNQLDAVVVGLGFNVQRTLDAPECYGFLSDIGYQGTKDELLEHLLPILEQHFDQFSLA